MLNTSNDQRKLLPNFEHLFAATAQATGGVARLRELILTLAVQGKLVAQDASDEPASELLKKIRAEKDRLIAEGKIKKDKPLLEITDEEKPFDLPVGWEWVRLGDLVRVLNGRAYKKQELLDEGPIPVLRVGNLFTSNHWYYSDLELEDDKYCSEGELLYAWSASFGPFIWSGPKVIYHYHIWKLDPWNLNSFDRGYLHRFLLEKTSEIKAAGHGISMAHMTKEKMERLLVAYPPLAEQSRIVTRVEELMSLCDALEEKGRLEHIQHQQLLQAMLDSLTQTTDAQELARHWQRLAQHFDLLIDRPEAVDALEQTILQLAVRGLLVPQDPSDEPASELLKKIRVEKDRLIAEGKIKKDKPLPVIGENEKPFELPKGWDWTRVGGVIEMLNGYAFKSEWFNPAGVRLLRNLNISHGTIDWSQPAFLDEQSANNYEAFSLKEGDLVLSLDRPIISTGLKYAVVRSSDLPCLLLQRVARLNSIIGVIKSEYLALWLQSDLFVGTIDPGRSNGIPHISTKQVSDLVFGLPPLAEQSRIVARVTELRALCQQLRDKLAQARTTQTQLAQAWVEQVAV